jgi:hypothetical protein
MKAICNRRWRLRKQKEESTMTNIPMPTEEQRRAALVLSARTRAERAELKRDMKAGKVTLAEALDDPRAQRIPIRQLLMSLPGIGSVKADLIMRVAGIAPSRRVKGVGIRQRQRLIEIFDSESK